jgi:hypothetical protein
MDVADRVVNLPVLDVVVPIGVLSNANSETDPLLLMDNISEVVTPKLPRDNLIVPSGEGGTDNVKF